MRRVSAQICMLLSLALALPPAGAAPRAPVPALPRAPVRVPRLPAPRMVPTSHLAPPATLLMEVSTGQVLETSDPHRRFPPASLDKLMTLYLTLQAIHSGRLSPDTRVTVSTAAWRIGRTPGSSRMFLNAGDTVSISQLLEGLMVASGNDAAEVLAETVSGSAERFVEDMNAAAVHLGMRDTHFMTPHGLPEPDEYTSAWDIALLARRLLLDDPDVVRWSSPRYETYGGIQQANWNNLVFRDYRVDGLKTGHTGEAGFSICATAREGDMRLISVVLGAPTLRRRTDLAEGMLTSGFSHYVLLAVPWKTILPAALTVYGGTSRILPLETAHPLTVLSQRGTRLPLQVVEQINARPFAPFQRGQQIGLLTIRRDGRVLVEDPVVAGTTIHRAGLLGRAWGFLRYTVGRLLHRHRPSPWSGTFTPQG
jgi:D-alanyl-D-alanine carboxypeptidase (penicillin-binding protein 5/6)